MLRRLALLSCVLFAPPAWAQAQTLPTADQVSATLERFFGTAELPAVLRGDLALTGAIPMQATPNGYAGRIEGALLILGPVTLDLSGTAITVQVPDLAASNSWVVSLTLPRTIPVALEAGTPWSLTLGAQTVALFLDTASDPIDVRVDARLADLVAAETPTPGTLSGSLTAGSVSVQATHRMSGAGRSMDLDITGMQLALARGQMGIDRQEDRADTLSLAMTQSVTEGVGDGSIGWSVQGLTSRWDDDSELTVEHASLTAQAERFNQTVIAQMQQLGDVFDPVGLNAPSGERQAVFEAIRDHGMMAGMAGLTLIVGPTRAVAPGAGNTAAEFQSAEATLSLTDLDQPLASALGRISLDGLTVQSSLLQLLAPELRDLIPTDVSLHMTVTDIDLPALIVDLADDGTVQQESRFWGEVLLNSFVYTSPGLTAEVEGSLTPAPGAPVPAALDLTGTLTGLDAWMERARNNQSPMVTQMVGYLSIAQLLGQQQGEDQRRYEAAVNPDGSVYLNGAQLRPPQQ